MKEGENKKEPTPEIKTAAAKPDIRHGRRGRKKSTNRVKGTGNLRSLDDILRGAAETFDPRMAEDRLMASARKMQVIYVMYYIAIYNILDTMD